MLAAGQGRRIGGRAKGSLRINGTTLIERQTNGLRASGIAEIAIVLGPYLETLLPIAERLGLQILVHGAPAHAQVDSQRIAIRHHVRTASERSPLWLLLSDLPLLAGPQFLAVADAWQRRPTGAQVLIPTVDGAPGHPVVLSAEAVRTVDALPDGMGVRDAIGDGCVDVWRWPTSDVAHVRDLDTEHDVERLRQEIGDVAIGW